MVYHSTQTGRFALRPPHPAGTPPKEGNDSPLWRSKGGIRKGKGGPSTAIKTSGRQIPAHYDFVISH